MRDDCVIEMVLSVTERVDSVVGECVIDHVDWIEHVVSVVEDDECGVEMVDSMTERVDSVVERDECVLDCVVGCVDYVV